VIGASIKCVVASLSYEPPSNRNGAPGQVQQKGSARPVLLGVAPNSRQAQPRQFPFRASCA
jgi:hypothetical protein